MNLHAHLAELEARADAALAIIDGTAADEDVHLFREGLGLEPEDDTDAEAEAFLNDAGYPFTREAGSPVVAVLAVGGPDIRVIRDGADYTLVGYAPGHPGAARSSATITRWGRLLEAPSIA